MHTMPGPIAAGHGSKEIAYKVDTWAAAPAFWACSASRRVDQIDVFPCGTAAKLLGNCWRISAPDPYAPQYGGRCLPCLRFFATAHGFNPIKT